MGQDPEIWLRNFRAHAEQLQRQAEAAQATLAANEATVEDRLMRITVSSGSQIKNIVFLPAASRAGAGELTASFRDLYAKAGAIVARTTLSVMAGLAGDDDPSLNLVKRQVPEDARAVMAAEDEAAGR